MSEVCASTGAGVVLMHTSTPPKQVKWDVDGYPDGVVAEVRRWFEIRMGELAAQGVATDTIVLDPGLDFGKTPAQSVELLSGFGSIASLGRPLMSAASRKDFVGALDQPHPTAAPRRDAGRRRLGGRGRAKVIRAHDVSETRDFVTILAALNGWSEVGPELRIADGIRREPQAEWTASG